MKQSPEDIEAEANEFAMCLLMPADWVRDEVAKLSGLDIEDERKLRKLAAKFRVSVPMMTLRIGQVLGAASARSKSME